MMGFRFTKQVVAITAVWVLLGLSCKSFSPAATAIPTAAPLATQTLPAVIPPTLALPPRPISSPAPWSACMPLHSGVQLPEVSYEGYPQAILDYLNQGGKPEELAPMLEARGVARPPYILAAVDTTGGGKVDIAVSLVNASDPLVYAPPGDLIVYVCQGDRYSLLYRRSSGEVEAGLQIYEAMDLNADGAAELVIGFPTCGAHTCFTALEILSWNGKSYENRLQGDSSDLPYPQVGVSDTDGDGIYDLQVTGTGFGSVGAGPPRASTRLWSFNPLTGLWEPAGEFPGAAEFRVHVVHDADNYARQGAYDQALLLYQQVLDDPNLKDWDVHDPADLSAYVRFKMALLHLILGQGTQAEAHYQDLVGSYAPGNPHYVFVEMTVIFRDGFLAGGAAAGCREVRAYIAQHHDQVLPFFDYGYGNPQYTAEDICPW